MVSFFSRLFNKKKVLGFKSIDELEKYFSAQTSYVIERENKKNHGIQKEVFQKIDELKFAIENLRNAELRNPDIEPRMKDFMMGNRTNYLTQLNYLINNLPGFEENFQEEYTELAKLFIEKTRKNDTILREFFSNEVRDVSIKMAELNGLVEKTSKPSKEWAEIKRITEKIQDYKNGEENLREYKNRNFEKELIDLRNKIELQKEEKTHLELSKEHTNYNSLIEEVRIANDFFNKLKGDIANLLSPASRSLKKYQRVDLENAELIEDYLFSPEEALCNDKENKILELVEKASNAEDNDKDKIKMERVKSQLSKEVLDTLRQRYLSLQEKITKLEEQKENNTVKQKLAKSEEEIRAKEEELRDLEMELEGFKTRIDELKSINKDVLNQVIKDVESHCFAEIKLNTN